MNNISFPTFLNKVLTSNERVQFSHVDPYGHLNSSKYVEFFLNHRIHAAEEQLKCFTMDIVKELSIGFVVQDINIRFLSPSFQGEVLEIASWVSSISEFGFTLNMIMASETKRKAKAIAKVKFVSIEMKTGRPIKLPEALPSRSTESLIITRPDSNTYISTLTGIPEDFI